LLYSSSISCSSSGAPQRHLSNRYKLSVSGSDSYALLFLLLLCHDYRALSALVKTYMNMIGGCNWLKGAITSKIKHAIKLKTSPARLAQLLQPSLKNWQQAKTKC